MKLILNKKRKIKKTICGQEFSLVPYINLSQKEFILNKLFEYYEENSEDSFVNLISGFRAILDALIVKAITDIETDGLEYDDMLSSGLIELIRKSVINYEEIMQDSFYFLQLNLLGKLLPNEKSLMESFSEIPKMFENMSPEQQKNLEMVVKASLANSASNAILGGIKGGN
jgi:hypothetical protein